MSRHAFSLFSRWFYCCLFFVSAAAVRAANVAYNEGFGATARVQINSVTATSTPGVWTVNFTCRVTTGPEVGTNTASAGAAIYFLNGVDANGYNKDLTTTFTQDVGISPGGSLRLIAGIGGKPSVEAYYYLGDPICGDVSYNYWLTGDDIRGTRYVVIKEPSTGSPSIIGEYTVGYGASEHVTGTIPEFCGTVKVQKYHYGDENPWQDFTPPPGPLTPPTPAPPGPSPQPEQPDVPDAPRARSYANSSASPSRSSHGWRWWY